MNELRASQGGELGAGTESAPVASPGALLRAARESAGMHAEALAVSLKVSVSKIYAMESDDYGGLPDAVFARALASSMCRSLKMDPAPVLALMPMSKVPKLEPDENRVKASFKDGSEKSVTGPVLSVFLRPVFWVVLALVLGAALLAFLPDLSLNALKSGAGFQGSSEVNVPPAPPPVSVASKTQVPQAAAVMTTLPVAATAPAETGADVPAGSAEAQPKADAVVQPESGLLVIRARNESWVQVRDATGATTFQRIIAAGETVVAQGKPPYSVVIGKADATEVFVQGKPFDLTAVSRENVARFEVKP